MSPSLLSGATTAEAAEVSFSASTFRGKVHYAFLGQVEVSICQTTITHSAKVWEVVATKELLEEFYWGKTTVDCIGSFRAYFIPGGEPKRVVVLKPIGPNPEASAKGRRPKLNKKDK